MEMRTLRSIAHWTRKAAPLLGLALAAAWYAHASAPEIDPSVAGLYNAIVGDADAPFNQAGMISITASKTGALTGKFMTGNVVLPLHGALHNMVSEIRIGSGPASVIVDLSIDSAALVMSGTVSTLYWAQPFSTIKSPAGKSAFASLAGNYTLLISPSTTGSGGEGCATMTVNPAGKVSMTGHTGAGQSFTAAACLNTGSAFPLFAVTGPARQDSVRGWVQFEVLSGTSDLDGAVTTCNASGTTAEDLPLIGSRYVTSGTAPALPFAAAKNNGILGFGPPSAMFATVPVTLTPAQLSSTSAQVSHLSWNKHTGASTGATLTIGNGATSIVSGVGITQVSGSTTYTGSTVINGVTTIQNGSLYIYRNPLTGQYVYSTSPPPAPTPTPTPSPTASPTPIDYGDGGVITTTGMPITSNTGGLIFNTNGSLLNGTGGTLTVTDLNNTSGGTPITDGTDLPTFDPGSTLIDGSGGILGLANTGSGSLSLTGSNTFGSVTTTLGNSDSVIISTATTFGFYFTSDIIAPAPGTYNLPLVLNKISGSTFTLSCAPGLAGTVTIAADGSASVTTTVVITSSGSQGDLNLNGL